jgi:hypothetical protein
VSDVLDARTMLAAAPATEARPESENVPLHLIPFLTSRSMTITPYWGERP